MLKKTFFTGVALAAITTALTIAAPLAAAAAGTTELSASPDQVAVGESSTITATGLGGLEEATFGLDGTPGGSLSTGSGAGSSTVQAAVTDGGATVDFSASAAGTFTVTVGDGENVMGTTTVTVTATQPSGQVTVAVSPATIKVGDTAKVEVSGIEGLPEVSLGLNGPAGGSLSTDGASWSASVQASVTDGTATAEFKAEEAGTYTIAAGDGETSLGETTITVEAASTPTPTPTPAPAPADAFPWVLFWIIIGVVVLAAVVTTIVLLARRKSGDKPA
ncbi:hypothetical protein GCM10009775_08760 [Microbacterium aoyamense]|uniref:Bacterial Ig-like domain-containing protein n=1 Tax=Microbacterium aoyamense TaxID=344166 RepID=A0ABP5ANQ6_9MICO|nr:hypothetical protein [Microbacterium aoyamense]